LKKLLISKSRRAAAAVLVMALLLMPVMIAGCGNTPASTTSPTDTTVPQSTTPAETTAATTTAPTTAATTVATTMETTAATAPPTPTPTIPPTAPATTKYQPAATTVSPSALLERWPAASTLPALYTANHANAVSATPLAGMTVLLDAGHGGADPGAVAGGVYEKTINLPIALKTRTLLQAKGANVVMNRTDDTYLSIYNRVAKTGLHVLGRASSLSGFSAQFNLALYQNDLGGIISANTGDADGSMSGRGLHLGFGVREEIRRLLDLERQFTDTIVVSIHANSNSSTQPRGMQVYYGSTEAIYSDEVYEIQQDRDVHHYGYPVYKAYTYYDDASRARLAGAVWNGIAALMPVLSVKPPSGVATNAGVQTGNYAVLRENNFTNILVETGFLSNPDDRAILLDPLNQDKIAQGIANGILAYFTSGG
jgi:N-acetylmuramoyl-L-alanine amidase